jgi:hypothetical protein
MKTMTKTTLALSLLLSMNAYSMEKFQPTSLNEKGDVVLVYSALEALGTNDEIKKTVVDGFVSAGIGYIEMYTFNKLGIAQALGADAKTGALPAAGQVGLVIAGGLGIEGGRGLAQWLTGRTGSESVLKKMAYLAAGGLGAYAASSAGK